MQQPESATLLIIDDETLLRRAIIRVLQREGYRCLDVPSAAAARAVLADEDVTLVLCDVMMPDEDGLSFIRWLREQPIQPALLMLTASECPRSINEALSLGAHGYILKPFQPNDLRIRIASALLRQQERQKQLNQAHEDTLKRLMNAAAFRDNETGAHIQRLGLYASEMARLLSWGLKRRSQLKLAAAMHDVGKVGISDAILLKPDRLTPDEWAQMRSHTLVGYQLLRDTGIPLLEMAARVAHSHHERWDGAGYPERLAGDTIPIEARIVAIVDVYDALCHARPYKEAWHEDDVIAYMRKRRGKQFDPMLLDLFIDNIEIMRDIRLRLPDVSPTGEAPEEVVW